MGTNPYSTDGKPFAVQSDDITITAYDTGLVVEWPSSAQKSNPVTGALDVSAPTLRSWSAQGVTGFKLYRGRQAATGEDSDSAATTAVSTTSVFTTVPAAVRSATDTVPALDPGTPYHYRVIPINDAGQAVGLGSSRGRAVPIDDVIPITVVSSVARVDVIALDDPVAADNDVLGTETVYFTQVQWPPAFGAYGFILKRGGVVVAAGPVSVVADDVLGLDYQTPDTAYSGVLGEGFYQSDARGFAAAAALAGTLVYADDVGPADVDADRLGFYGHIRRHLSVAGLTLVGSYDYQLFLCPRGYANWTDEDSIYASSAVVTHVVTEPVGADLEVEVAPGYRQAVVSMKVVNTVDPRPIKNFLIYLNSTLNRSVPSTNRYTLYGDLNKTYTAVFTGLTNGEDYDFFVRIAYMDGTIGDATDAITVTPASPGGNLLAAPSSDPPFEWDDVALPAAVVDADGPLVLGVIRWRFVDPADDSTYTVPINPNKMTSPLPPRAMSTAATTGVDSRPLMFEGGLVGHEWNFSGVIFDKAHLDALTEWSKKQNRFFIFDHFGRRFTVAPRQLDATPTLRQKGKYWRHDYTFSAYVLKVN